MSKLKFVRVLLLVAMFAGGAAAAKTPESVEVVALNFEWFPGQTPLSSWLSVKRHIHDTRTVLKKISPDILIATEICDGKAFKKALSAVPGLELHVISNFIDVEDGGNRRNQQIAIASNLKAFAGWAEPWEQTMENLRRGFSFAALENPASGGLILVYGVHLKSNRSGTPEQEQQNYDIRDASVDQLLAHMEKMQKEYEERGIDGWIVAGDFNTNHDGKFGDRVIAKLEEAGFSNSWGKTKAADRHTWKARGPFEPTTFDYIMTKDLGNESATVHEVPDEVSDHNAVVLKVKLPQAAAPKEQAAAE